MIHKNDRDLQRILWRKDDTAQYVPIKYDHIRNFKRTLLGRTDTSQQLAVDVSVNYRNGSKTVLRDFYVDDLMAGADSISEAIKLQKEILELLLSASFKIR